jgi:hypothetical protein
MGSLNVQPFTKELGPPEELLMSVSHHVNAEQVTLCEPAAVFDRSRDLFIVYADRKLLTPEMIARIETVRRRRGSQQSAQKELGAENKTCTIHPFQQSIHIRLAQARKEDPHDPSTRRSPGRQILEQDESALRSL